MTEVLSDPAWTWLHLRRLRFGPLVLLLAVAALLVLSQRYGTTSVPFGDEPTPNWLLLSMVTVTVSVPYLAMLPTRLEAGTRHCTTWFLATPQVLATLLALAAGVVFAGSGLASYYLSWTLAMLAVANLWVCLLGHAAWCPIFLTWALVFGAHASGTIDIYRRLDHGLVLFSGAWAVSSLALAASRRRRLTA